MLLQGCILLVISNEAFLSSSIFIFDFFNYIQHDALTIWYNHYVLNYSRFIMIYTGYYWILQFCSLSIPVKLSEHFLDKLFLCDNFSLFFYQYTVGISFFPRDSKMGAKMSILNLKNIFFCLKNK
jgi:hypothetical protein